MAVYQVPSSIEELFTEQEAYYQIIDYSDSMCMDNNQSMQFFLNHLGFENEHIVEDNGTQVIIQDKDFHYKLQINARGLGDCYSHGFDVSLHEG